MVTLETRKRWLRANDVGQDDRIQHPSGLARVVRLGALSDLASVRKIDEKRASDLCCINFFDSSWNKAFHVGTDSDQALS